VNRARAWLPSLIAIAAALALLAPWRGVYWWASHEKYWYPVRVVEWVEAWRAGAWYPRWCPDLFGGYGYPFFDFYPPGVFAGAGALVLALGLSTAAALKTVIAAFAIAGAIGAYGLVRGETRRSDAALVGALVFVALPYRANDLWARGDLAEYAALSLVPLALWAHRAFLRAPADRAARAGTLAALAHAAVILCHTLTRLYVTEVLGAMIAASTIARWSEAPARRRALTAGVVLALGVAMAAVYLVPAWIERSIVQVLSMTAGEYQTKRNFIAGRLLVEAGPLCIGLPAAIGLYASLVALARAETRRRASELLRWWAPAIGFAALTLAPAAIVWRAVPLQAYVQFPWRLLGFAGAFAAAAIGVTWAAAIAPSLRAPWRWAPALAASIAIFVAGRPYGKLPQAIAAADVPETPRAIQALAKSSTVVDEYTPAAVFPIPRRPRPFAAQVVDGPARVTAVSRALTEELTIDADGPAELDVARFDFPGWRASTEEGPAAATFETSINGLIHVRVPRAGHYRVRVAFGSTPLRDGAAALSLLALLGCWPLLRRFTRG